MNNLEFLWHPDQYAGQRRVVVTATQLDDRVRTAAERHRILSAWIEFFSSCPTGITEIDLRSRVPQLLLDSLSGQPQLRSLRLKWGPYRDIGVIASMPHLAQLSLGGATALESLGPLRNRSSLKELTVAQGHRISDLSPISSLPSVADLWFGGYIGSDRTVQLADLRWVAPLASLQSLGIPGTRLIDPDLSPLLELPRLDSLRLPLRRDLRAQVFHFASRSPVFAAVAAEYTAYEAWRGENVSKAGP